MTQFDSFNLSSTYQAVPTSNCRAFSVFNNSGGTMLIRRVNDTKTAEVLDGRSMNDIVPQKNSNEFEVKSPTGTGKVSFTFDEIAG